MNRLIVRNITLYPNQKDRIDNAQLIIEDGKVAKITKDFESVGEVIDGQNLNCLPGFIDVHVHGGYGYDFLTQPEEALKTFEENIAKEGTTGYLASLVSGHHESYLSALPHYRDLSNTQCLGVHLEGPYLSRNYMAVMDPSTIREPVLDEFKELYDLANGNIAQMTIAPELDNSLELIKWGSDHNISMMLGHSDARIKDVRAAIENGAIGVTHLYNAMSPHSHRDPGLVTGAFLFDSLICEIISDGFHVDPDVIRVTFSALGSKKLALVTDATLMRGLPDGQYLFSSYLVNKSGIKATVKDTGRIAGSVVGMDDVVRKFHEFTGCTLNQIVEMASINPSIIARADKYKGKLDPGYDADFVLLNDSLNVIFTYSKGMRKY